MNTISKRIFVFQLLILFGIGLILYFSSGIVTQMLINGDLTEENSRIYRVGLLILILGSSLLFILKINKKNINKEYLQHDLYKLASALDNVQKAVTIIGADDKIEYANKEFFNMYGYTNHETLGNKTSSLIAGPLTDHTFIKEVDQHIFKYHKPFSGRVIQYRKDKTNLWATVHVTPYLNEKGKLIGYMSISEDISELKKVEDFANKQRSDFNQIVQTLSDSVYLYDIQNKKYDFISENVKELLGVGHSIFYAGTSHDYLNWHPEDISILKEAKIKVENGVPYDIEYRILVENELKWIQEKSYPIKNSDGKAIRNSGICSDITLLKRSQEHLKNKTDELLQSIHYAKNIQNSTFPSKKEIESIFQKHVLVFKPKDIVSGDFYYVSKINSNNETELHSFILADCTGHGVPGALLSIMCNNILQSTFTNSTINSPSQAVEFTRKKLINLFSRSEDRIYDGMDMSFGVINPNTNELYFCGAKHNCYIIRNNELIIIRGNRVHVGYVDDLIPFTDHFIQLYKGDRVFVTSDGYLDQFGGENNKKFGKSQFLNLLINHNDSMDNLESLLYNTLTEWQGNNEQTDDVCVFGFEI